MEMNQNNREFDIKKDPYNHMRHVIFNRWKPYILQAVFFDSQSDRPTYFSAFFKQLPITQKVLSQNLRELEQDGLLTRNVVPVIPPRVEYRLTEYGRTIIPILNAVYAWGWEDMNKKGMSIDQLGEMWHGYRDKDKACMDQPYSRRENRKQG